jgi:hypothetical protein
LRAPSCALENGGVFRCLDRKEIPVSTKLTIPPDLVAPLRDGACIDMYEQYKEAEALMEQGNWPGPRAEVEASIARAQATWRLLEAMAVSEVERVRRRSR